MTPKNNESSPNTGDTATILKKGAKGILCRNCNHVNRPTATKCSRCESHLHIKCKDCGAHNERVYDKCQECGRRLHRSLFKRINNRFFSTRSRVTPMQLVWLLIFAAVAFYFITVVNNVRLDAP